MVSEATVPRIAPHVQIETSEEDAGAVLIDGRTGQLFSCNDSGGVLAQCLAEGMDLDGLARVLTERFDVDHNRALRDAAAFTESLGAADLLVAAGSQSSDEAF